MEHSLTDPLGRSLTLHDATWYGHIVKGHPDVAVHRKIVEKAIRQPSSIYISVSDSDCRLYYGTPNTVGLMMCVVVDVVGGYVKTAYWCKKAKAGVLEWEQPKP